MMVMVVGLEDMDALSNDKVLTKADLVIEEERNKLLFLYSIAKIVVAQFQLLVAIGGMANVYWPPAATLFFDGLQICHFLADASAALECILQDPNGNSLASFYDNVTVSVLGPPLVIAALFAIELAINKCVFPCQCKWKCGPCNAGSDKASGTTRQTNVHQYLENQAINLITSGSLVDSQSRQSFKETRQQMRRAEDLYKSTWFFHSSIWIVLFCYLAMGRVSVQLFSCYELPGSPTYSYGWHASEAATRAVHAAAIDEFVAAGGNASNLTMCAECSEADIAASLAGQPTGGGIIDVRDGQHFCLTTVGNNNPFCVNM